MRLRGFSLIAPVAGDFVPIESGGGRDTVGRDGLVDEDIAFIKNWEKYTDPLLIVFINNYKKYWNFNETKGSTKRWQVIHETRVPSTCIADVPHTNLSKKVDTNDIFSD